MVAADEGPKNQTIESLEMAQEWGLPVIVAINKIDLPNATPVQALEGVLEHSGQLPLPSVLEELRSTSKSRPTLRRSTAQQSLPSSFSKVASTMEFWNDLVLRIDNPGAIKRAIGISAKNKLNYGALIEAIRSVTAELDLKAGNVNLGTFRCHTRNSNIDFFCCQLW